MDRWEELFRILYVPHQLSTPRHYMNDTSPYLGEAAGVPIRPPYESENNFFSSAPHVAGYASPDGAVVLNPYSTIGDAGRRSVAINEGVRQQLRGMPDGIRPNVELTQAQRQSFLGSYSPNPQDISDTVIARILSADPSVGEISPEQYAQASVVLRWILGKMGGAR